MLVASKCPPPWSEADEDELEEDRHCIAISGVPPPPAAATVGVAVAERRSGGRGQKRSLSVDIGRLCGGDRERRFDSCLRYQV